MTKVLGLPFRIVVVVGGGAWTVTDDQTFRYDEDPEVASSFYTGNALEEFLAVREETQVLPFLNRIGGCFYPDAPGELDSQATFRPGIESIADFFAWQTIIKKLMIEPPTSWGFLTNATHDAVEPSQMNFSEAGTNLKVNFGALLDTLDFMKASAIADSFRFPLNFVWQKNGKHYLRVEATDILKAIMAAVGLGHISRTIHRFCRRKDCGKHFILKTKHPRKFCTPECAHVVAVRASRRRAVKKKLGKVPKTAGKL